MAVNAETGSGLRGLFWTRALLFGICIGLAIGGFWLYVLSTTIYENYRDFEVERVQRESNAAARIVKYEVEHVLAEHPEAKSLREIKSTLSKLCTKRRGQDIELLSIRIVGPDYRVIAASPADLQGHIDKCAEAAHVAAGRERHFMHQKEHPGPICVAVPIVLMGQVMGGLVIHTSMELVNKKSRAMRHEMVMGVYGAITLLYLMWGLVLYRLLQRERAMEKLRENAERMTALGNLAAGVAHEIRNPLNTIALTIQYLERLHARSAGVPSTKEIQQNFRLIHNEINRLGNIIDSFINFARPRPVHPESVPVDALLDETFQLFERELQTAGIRLERDVPKGVEAFVDREGIRQCFINVIKNAVEAMEEGGVIRVRVAEERDGVRISFSDSGKGIAPKDVERLFDPYFSTKTNGLGVGLAITKRILMDHGGDIYVESELGRGATFTLILPAKESRA